MRTGVLIVAATALLASGGLQAQRAPGSTTAASPAPLDRATVLREVGIAHGMLRGLGYNDATTTAQYQATGIQYIVGQSFKPGGPWPAAKLTKYNVWIIYAVALLYGASQQIFFAARSGLLVTSSWPVNVISKLLLGSLLLVVLSLVMLAQFSGAPPNSTYIPAHIENGKLVPGVEK